MVKAYELAERDRIAIVGYDPRSNCHRRKYPTKQLQKLRAPNSYRVADLTTFDHEKRVLGSDLRAIEQELRTSRLQIKPHECISLCASGKIEMPDSNVLRLQFLAEMPVLENDAPFSLPFFPDQSGPSSTIGYSPVDFCAQSCEQFLIMGWERWRVMTGPPQ